MFRQMKSGHKADPNRKLQTYEELERLARESLRRDANQDALRRYKEQGVSSFNEKTEIVVGSKAIEHHVLHPDDGIFSKSPKSFLASEISPIHLQSFQTIISRMLSCIKQAAEDHSQSSFDSVVLGRPVNYSPVATESGNLRAVDIMCRAANSAGFRHVEFEYEPVAAALDFERTLDREKLVLVIDIGGGTTDVTMMTLSPNLAGSANRKDHIHAATGSRVGGNDLDILFALYKICRHLGKESLDRNRRIINRSSPVPLDIYWQATHVNNIQAIESFRSNSTGQLIAKYAEVAQGELKNQIERLKQLHSSDYTFRLNRSSELAKILLSSEEKVILPLKYLEPDFQIQLDREDLRDAINFSARQIREVVSECIRLAGSQPEVVYVTGGSAKSTTLMDLILTDDLKSKVLSGDHFGSVAQGLVIAAQNRFE